MFINRRIRGVRGKLGPFSVFRVFRGSIRLCTGMGSEVSTIMRFFSKSLFVRRGIGSGLPREGTGAYPSLDPGQRDKPMFAGVLLGSDPGHVPGQRRDKQRDPGRKARSIAFQRFNLMPSLCATINADQNLTQLRNGKVRVRRDFSFFLLTVTLFTVIIAP